MDLHPTPSLYELFKLLARFVSSNYLQTYYDVMDFDSDSLYLYKKGKRQSIVWKC